ncbi:MAG: universal stress protein [Actinobacteria bacterium]|uniref:Unannotated protein n=1 Tax=freshwater metagenome TaxID=449393 RepID=A0A6J6RMH3_9ZZZZ|nr:universal stress protein [Actinomycetota bacterium]
MSAVRPGAVVVAWTPDAFGEIALAHGVHEATLRGRDLMVVNATKGDSLVDPAYAGSEAMSSLTDTLAASGLAHEVRQQVGLDVAEVVLELAREVDARLVVVGLRRRTPVGKLIMGSVAQRVILDSSCPVLAVRPGETPS